MDEQRPHRLYAYRHIAEPHIAANHYNYTFLHYRDPDSAGHSSGWGSGTWNDSVSTVDGYLGQLFNLVDNDATLAGRTAIILSADHGGTGTGHDAATAVTNYTIPFFAWGAGVGQGDLYTINSDTRVDPGTSRPDYNAIGQPIRNGDGGNLALSLLGLGPIPGSLINAAQSLRVAVPEPASSCLLLASSFLGLMFRPLVRRPSVPQR